MIPTKNGAGIIPPFAMELFFEHQAQRYAMSMPPGNKKLLDQLFQNVICTLFMTHIPRHRIICPIFYQGVNKT
jgi:hypothetical protein